MYVAIIHNTITIDTYIQCYIIILMIYSSLQHTIRAWPFTRTAVDEWYPMAAKHTPIHAHPVLSFSPARGHRPLLASSWWVCISLVSCVHNCPCHGPRSSSLSVKAKKKKIEPRGRHAMVIIINKHQEILAGWNDAKNWGKCTFV